MKKSITACFGLILMMNLLRQEPVHWDYSMKKIDAKTIEVHLTATMDEGWHIYSQNQPKEAIAMPANIQFNKNPLFIFSGKVKEVGTLEKHTEKTIGITQYQYSDKVDFVQVIKLRANAKTNISGRIEFQACTDKMCLPPDMVSFNMKVE